MQITFLGHATVQIEEAGLTVLTDPIFSRHVLGLPRQSPFPCDPASLPNPTAVFISHAHYDHLDLPTFKYFSERTAVILPEGLKSWMEKFSRHRLIEIAHGETVKIQEGLEVSVLPVAHTGWRLSGLRFRRCNGYRIRIGDKTIFFPGDTGYRDFRRDLATLGGGPIDVALLPIGAYRPEWFMKKRHLNPREAVAVFKEIGARIMIPIHWGTFRLSSESLDEPIQWLTRLSQEENLTDRIKILRPGESLSF